MKFSFFNKIIQKSIFLLLILGSKMMLANIVLPNIFSSGMVLQQKSKVKIWGWGKPGETVTVQGTWDEQVYVAKVNNMGKWEVETITPVFGGPYNLVIKGNNKIVLSDVLVGEVWLVSGQSNMEWNAASGIDQAEQEINAANFPQIRFFSVAHNTAEYPQLNLDGSWQACNPETMKYFSAIGYFFAKEIFENTQIPIGIINSSWGGTPAEAWMPEMAVKTDPKLWKNAQELKEVAWWPVKTASVYNAMIAPITSFKIKGVLWYQGESNVGHAAYYDQLLSTLIQSWRSAWNEIFPFYYVQIAPYKYETINAGVLLRNSQRKVEDQVANTRMVVISDIGNNNDIHPQNKKGVALRLAKIALNNDYGFSNKNISEPKLLTYETKRNQVILYFDSEIKSCDTNCKSEFEIADISGVFKKAKVRIKSNTISLSHEDMSYPIFARYAWSNTNSSLLSNESQLPASSFVTDNWLDFMGY
jgi:sialate O-acetylesterase